MYEEILVPTDGSPAAAAAVDHAVAVARQFDAALRVLYVVDTNVYSTMDAGMENVIDSLERDGERAVESVRETADDAGVPVETEVRRGRVHRTIGACAAETDTDLIVMGTHGRQGLDRYLLGSVTERVVRTADQPVLTVRYTGDHEDHGVDPVADAADSTDTTGSPDDRTGEETDDRRRDEPRDG